ncbi:MAG TPA: ferritin-like domain-containing protein [Streptosporangiaceae bacterium]
MTASPAPGAARERAAAIRALQTALAAEHTAVYGYAVAGAHLTGSRQKAATRDWIAHQTARDALTAMVAALGAQPVPASATYQLPFAVRGAQAAVALLALLEDGLATAYLGLVALTGDRLRLFGAQGVQTAALRATGWRGSTLAFPGLAAPAAR